MRKTLALILLALVPATNGCGTVLNIQETTQTKMFGGVYKDAVGGSSEISSSIKRVLTDSPPDAPHEKFPPAVDFGLGILAFADLPFSLVGDMLTLPSAFGAEFARFDTDQNVDAEEWKRFWLSNESYTYSVIDRSESPTKSPTADH